MSVGLRTWAKRAEPGWIRQRRLKMSLKRLRSRNMQRPIEEVFTDIYTNGTWGSGPEGFSSGEGTRNVRLVERYVALVESLADEKGFRGARFVDLGCGDFVVGRQLVPLAGSYVGIDIARPVIQRNNATFATDSVSFGHANLVVDELPDGDVCFIRQVLQHLSNDEIQAVLGKLQKYRWVVITEHLPVEGFLPNRDKPHGSDTRLADGSGVILTEAPFSIPEREVREEASILVVAEDPSIGQLTTWLYEPGRVGAAQ